VGKKKEISKWVNIAGINAEIGQHNLDQFLLMQKDRNHWRAIANRLGTHMGEALYGDDEWSCREYAIAAYSEWERQPDSHLCKYDVDPKPVWYFKNGEQV
jgi:hypothetical protein